MDPLFAALPESLSSLSDTELTELVAAHARTFGLIKANDAATLGDRTAAQILDEAKAGKEAYATLKAEQAARADAVATYDAEITSLTSDIDLVELATETDPPPDGDPAPDPAPAPAPEAEALEAETEEPVLEPVTAAAVRRPPPAPITKHKPVAVDQEDTRSVPILASAGLPYFAAGQPMTKKDLGEALHKALLNTTAGAGEKVVIASARYADRVPDDRKLSMNDHRANHERIEALTEQMQFMTYDALTAAGGNCAPLTPYYALQNISVQDRPVRDALAGFIADRGGITWMPPPALSSITTAVGYVTEAHDRQGGTYAAKTCQTVACVALQTQQVDSVFACLTFGNLMGRSYPELVAHENNLARAAHARLAETLLLDTIKAGSVHTTGAAVNGAINTYFGHLLEEAAALRSANRMGASARLRVLAPSWIRDLLVLDIVRSQFDRFAYAQDGVEQLLDRFNLNVSFYLDGSSDGGQIYAAQTAGVVLPFPTTVETYMFPEGTWLFLDAGTLDLGIVRDSVLNAQNQYQLFAETFEHAAKVGVVSSLITSTICPNGVVAAPGTGLTC